MMKGQHVKHSPGRAPTREQLETAHRKRLRDLIAPGLTVLFCGINPGLYSAAVGHHFARPGNRFWPTLHASGFTSHLFHPQEDVELLKLGLGLTNIVGRTTARAALLERQELMAGAGALRKKVRRYRPRVLAIVGFSAYRVAFQDPNATGGLQPTGIDGTSVWLLPNPSGLNAHYPPAELVRCFAALRKLVNTLPPLPRNVP
jgi:TDG/mug DNA glycosylase family protein